MRSKRTNPRPHNSQVYNRVRDGNFSLEGITPGWDLKDRTVGVLGTGRIGEAFVRIMVGMGCRVLGYDARENPRLQKLQQRTRAVSAGDDDEGGAVGGSFKYATLEEIWPVRLGSVSGGGGGLGFGRDGCGLAWEEEGEEGRMALGRRPNDATLDSPINPTPSTAQNKNKNKNRWRT